MKKIEFNVGKIGMQLRGNKVVLVMPGGQADEAGVTEGWTVLEINGKSQPDDAIVIQNALKESNSINKPPAIIFRTDIFYETAKKTPLKQRKQEVGPDNSKSIYLIAFITVIVASFNKIVTKVMANELSHHMFFLSIFAVPVVSAIFWMMVAFRKNPLPTETTNFPKSKIACMAIFDTLQSVLVMFTSARTPGQIQQLLGKSTIPLTLVIKWVWLSKAPNSRHIIGAFSIVCGAILPFGYMLLEGTQNSTSDMIFYLIFFVSTIPAAVGCVYKEVALTAHSVDDNYLNTWIGFFQCFLTLFSFPLYALPILGDDAMPIEQIFPKLYEGFICVVGRSGEKSCHTGWLYVVLWLGSMFLYNMLMTKIIARAGATIMFAVATLTTPISALAFSIPIVMGSHTESFRIENLIGLIFICLGIVIYRMPMKKTHAE